MTYVYKFGILIKIISEVLNMNETCLNAREAFELRWQQTYESYTNKRKSLFGDASKRQSIIVDREDGAPQLSNTGVIIEGKELDGLTGTHGHHKHRYYELNPEADIIGQSQELTKDELYLIMTMGDPNLLSDPKLQEALTHRLFDIHKKEQIQSVIEGTDTKSLREEQKVVVGAFQEMFSFMKGAIYVPEGRYFIPEGITPEKFRRQMLDRVFGED